MQTREQKYAKDVYIQVHEVWASGENYKKYGSMAHKLPILVRQAGLTQALAFAATRKPAAQHKLLEHLAATVLGADVNELLQQSRELSLLQYMRLTDDVMLALTWYKRYAQSVLGVDATEDDDTPDDDQ